VFLQTVYQPQIQGYKHRKLQQRPKIQAKRQFTTFKNTDINILTINIFSEKANVYIIVEIAFSIKPMIFLMLISLFKN